MASLVVWSVLTYFWLCWVFVPAYGLSSCRVRATFPCSMQISHCDGLPIAVEHGLQSSGSVVVTDRAWLPLQHVGSGFEK